MKVAILSFCVFLIASQDVVSNEILGRIETKGNSQSWSSSTVNGKTSKNVVSSSSTEVTTWEIKPDKSCIKRVVVTKNGVTTQDSQTPIDCAQAKKEVGKISNISGSFKNFHDKWQKAQDKFLGDLHKWWWA